ncbi:MAG TPA: chromate efflux transporter [Acidimicrobiales bacterium]
MTERLAPNVALTTIVREWGRIGFIGFGGPPAHIALFRQLCVDERAWLSASEFEDAVAAANLLPGPASTQLAIFCAWRLRGKLGALLGGLCFIVPGLAIILALAVLFLAKNAPLWVHGAAAGASAVVPVVALSAALRLVRASWQRANNVTERQIRWLCYFVAGAVAAITLGSFLVLVLVACGLAELSLRREPSSGLTHRAFALLPATLTPVASGGLVALSWVALKVGALSYGGGFVIVPLMQHDAVVTYHWMTGAQFLSAVALGQVTPGPVMQTVAVVGYAAGGLGAGLLAALVAFAPSFLIVIAGASHFDRLRSSALLQGFLTGAGAAVIGAIAGSSVPLARELAHVWQFGVLGLGLVWLVALRRSVVTALLGAGVLGVIAVLAGAPH